MLRKILPGLITVLLFTGCGGNANPQTEITLEMTDFSYNSPSLTVPVGQPVVITLENQGLVEHDFVIEKIEANIILMDEHGSDAHNAHGEASDYDVHASTQAGQTTTLELTVLEPGTYQFFCSVEGHLEAGMIGELVVLAEE
jgi:uncharacterized cupredoxin-like copper-binding protein